VWRFFRRREELDSAALTFARFVIGRGPLAFASYASASGSRVVVVVVSLLLLLLLLLLAKRTSSASCQLSVAHSSANVLPVPVGLSSRALRPEESAPIVFDITANCGLKGFFPDGKRTATPPIA
jgi:hypothetical protein